MVQQAVAEAAARAAQVAVDRSRAEMMADVRSAMRDVMDDALRRLGVDPGDPIEMQRDMGFLREWRGTVAGVRKKGLMTAVGVLVAGALGALWLGLTALLR